MTPPQNRDELRQLITDFVTYLVQLKGLSMGTARAYSVTVSGAITKHADGFKDEPGLAAYVREIAFRSPAQHSIFLAAWKHFAAYMDEWHGEEVPKLEIETEDRRVGNRPPADAVYDLHLALRGVSIQRLSEVRWGDVSQLENGGYAIRITKEFSAAATLYILTSSAIEGLTKLQTWGWPNGVKVAHAHIIPDAPNSEGAITKASLSHLIRTERAKRRAEAQQAPVAKTLVLPTVATAATKAATAPPPPKDPALELIRTQYDFKQISATDTTPPGITDEMKHALYMEWCQLEPPKQPFDSYMAEPNLNGFTEFGSKDQRARWRRVRWEVDLPNDFGPPPQSLSKVGSPLSYVPEPIVIPPPAVPDPKLLEMASKSSTPSDDGVVLFGTPEFDAD